MYLGMTYRGKTVILSEAKNLKSLLEETFQTFRILDSSLRSE